MKRRTLLAGVFALAAGLFCTTLVQAQDKKVDVTGKWTWSQAGRQGGQAREITLTLKQEGDKVTGSMPGRQGGDPVEISNGKVTGDMLAFEVTREFNGNKITTKYSGKVDGDTIKGKIEQPGRDGGAPTPRDWEAKRAK